MYNSETQTIKEEQKRTLRVFEMKVLRKMRGITRRDRRQNVDVGLLKELAIEKDIQHKSCSVVAWLTYFGHVTRMGIDSYPLCAPTWIHAWSASK